MDSIKITALTNIGSNLAYNSLVPVVNMNGTPVTQKANLQIVGNLFLQGAGGSYFPPAAQAVISQTVSNAAQPNITSVGTLTTLTVTGNMTTGNINGGNLISANFFSGDGGFLSNIQGSPGGSDTQVQFNDAGSFGGEGNFTYDSANHVLNVTRANASYLTAYESVSTANLSANGLASIARINVTNTANLGAVGNITITGGSNGQVLSTDGAGSLSWVNAGGAGSYGNSNVANYLPTFTGNLNGNSLTVQQDVSGNGALRLQGIANGNSTINIGGEADIDVVANVGNINLYTANNQPWIFDQDGNLTLPGNTFAVNYANGTQVSIGGGSGNTGNVTFDNQAVVGTGDIEGGGGLYLAPGNASVGNVQYLRVRGGDYPTHIHLDTGNNAYYDQYFGDDYKYIVLHSGGNILINTNDLVGNTAQWDFGPDGNLILPNDANIAIYGNTTQFNTCPNGFLGLNSYDAGNNVARVGISGTDKAVFIGVSDPVTEIDYNWSFANGGGTIFPTLDTQRGDNPSGTITGQTLLFGDNTQEAIISTPDGTSNINSSQRLVINPGEGYQGGEGGDIYLWAGRGGNASGSGGDIKIRGGQGGSNTSGGLGGSGGYIRMEAGDAATTGGYPGYIDITGGYSNTVGGNVNVTGGQGYTVGGDVNVTGGYGTATGGNVNIWGGASGNGQINEGNVNIQTGGYTWTFDPLGNFKLPDTTTINANASITLEANSSGNVSGLNVNGDADANLYAHNNVVIYTDSNGTGNTWTFDIDGKLTLPNGAVIKDTVTAAIAFGDGAGANTQGAYSVAVGAGAGANTQGTYAVAVGSDAGAETQGINSVAIGYNAGNATQGLQAVAVGAGAGQNTQGINSVAIGYSAGVDTQGEASIAIGQNAGNTTQGNSAVAIGVYAGQTNQGDDTVAIGDGAGQTGQKEDAVAIGQNAGQTNQGISSVAIGYGAGFTDQGNQSVAIGENAGANQGSTAVAIGQNAGGGVAYQNDDAVAIGHSAGEEDQGTQAIAIGLYTGQVAQGLNSIALGAYAGQTNQANNSIILNATGSALEQTVANTFTVKPVRQGNTANAMYYDASTGEITYDTAGGGANTGNVTFDNVNIIGDGNLNLQPDPANAGAYLNIYLTGGPDIHIAGNGENVILGTDDFANVTVNVDGTVSIQASNGTPQTWTFDTSGNLVLPSGGSIYSQSSTPSGAPGNTITLQPAGSGITTNQKLLVYPTAADGDHIHMTSGNLYETELFLGSDNLYVKLANTGNVVINSNDGNSSNAMWTFGTDGNLTLPGNLVINGLTNVFGSNVALLASNPDLPLLSISSGSNGGVSSLWAEDIGNIGTSNIAAVYTNPTPGSKIVRIAVGQNGGNTGPNLWDFNANGNLSAPGAISAVGNISANNFTGNGGGLSNVATKTTGSWTLVPGVNTANISVPTNGTYSIWINGNIPNGIVTYIATAVVTNTNVPVLGEQYGWYYEAGNALVLTSIPNQFVGTQGAISNAVVATTTANVFTFGITNNSGANAVVNYGYTKL